MEGTRKKGDVYYTNEGATLEYVDINGDYAKKDYPMPAVAWGGASTSYEYYLVNEKGEPVNRCRTESAVCKPYCHLRRYCGAEPESGCNHSGTED